jgi:prepilin-type N-terminal cleavage/methylation domain-containing protein
MKRHGATLIEMIVVVGIMAILIGLSLSAIQKVRVQTLRAETSNRLRQIGLGLMSFENERQYWPTMNGERLMLSSDSGTSATSDPHGHLMTLYPHINPGSASVLYKSANYPFEEFVIRDFQDPADPTLFFEAEFINNKMKSSYVCNWQVFRDGKKTYPSTVTDGRSNTIAYTTKFSNRCGKSIPPYIWGSRVYLMVGHPESGRACFADGGPGSLFYKPSNSLAALPAEEWPMDYPLVRPGSPTIGHRHRTFIVTSDPERCDFRVPVSAHPGGLLVCLTDGSVRQLTPNIAQENFWAMVTPNAGDTYNLD